MRAVLFFSALHKLCWGAAQFLTPHLTSPLTKKIPPQNLKPAAELLDHGFQAIIYKWDGGNFIG